MLIKKLHSIWFTVIILFISGCSSLPKSKANDACAIFKHYNSWYWAAQKAEKKWGVPIAVMLSMIYQESSFDSDAKPPRTRILWIIPWKRPTTAYGYCQAVDPTWKLYEKDTCRSFAYRNSFADSVDFIGWYANKAYKRTRLNKKDAMALYLAYHEGIGGYSRKTYLKKPWLIKTAKKVRQRARMYRIQMENCKSSLPGKPWYRLFY